MTSSSDTQPPLPAGTQSRPPTQRASCYRFQELEQTVALATTPTDIVTAARAEAEQIREQAAAAGKAAGYAEGVQRGLADAAPLAETFRAAAGSLEASFAELRETLARQATQLAVAIAEQALSTTFEVRPERLLEVTRGALRRLSERERVTIKVSPDDLELITRQTAKLAQELGGIEHLDVQAERRVARGGVIVSTEAGEIDCTLEAELHTVREIVRATFTEGDDGAEQ